MGEILYHAGRAAWNLLTYPVQWLFRCRACGAFPGGHYPSCRRLWRNGGEITGSGDAWYKEHGYPRDWEREGPAP